MGGVLLAQRAAVHAKPKTYISLCHTNNDNRMKWRSWGEGCGYVDNGKAMRALVYNGCMKWIILMNDKPANLGAYKNEKLVFFARTAYRGRGLNKNSVFNTEAEAKSVIKETNAFRRRMGWNVEFDYKTFPIEI